MLLLHRVDPEMDDGVYTATINSQKNRKEKAIRKHQPFFRPITNPTITNPTITNLLGIAQQPPSHHPSHVSSQINDLLELSEHTTHHMPLAQHVLDSAFLRSRGLCEGCRAAEGARKSGVLHAYNADI